MIEKNPLILAARKLRAAIEEIESTGNMELRLMDGCLAIAWDDCGFRDSHLILKVQDPNAEIMKFDPRPNPRKGS